MLRIYYQTERFVLYCGDVRELPTEALPPITLTIADPPYQQTTLAWDRWPTGWVERIPGNSLWVFGTLRSFLQHSPEFSVAGWKFAQDVIWEKQNGTGFSRDRFRRVHEQVAHWYKGPWKDVYSCPPVQYDAVAKTVRRRQQPQHLGKVNASTYIREAGGARLVRSVFHLRNCHRKGYHPTEKPQPLIRQLIAYSCPVDAWVFVPFVGGGADLVAACATDRRVVGCEISEELCEIATKRLVEGVSN